jgi:hypothetical protein
VILFTDCRFFRGAGDPAVKEGGKYAEIKWKKQNDHLQTLRSPDRSRSEDLSSVRRKEQKAFL